MSVDGTLQGNQIQDTKIGPGYYETGASIRFLKNPQSYNISTKVSSQEIQKTLAKGLNYSPNSKSMKHITTKSPKKYEGNFTQRNNAIPKTIPESNPFAKVIQKKKDTISSARKANSHPSHRKTPVAKGNNNVLVTDE